MARVSALCGRHSVCRLHARCFLGGAHVSLSARRTNLHHAMVFTRRVSLVPVALRRWTIDALYRAGAGSFAIGGRLVVREQSTVSLVRRDRARHSVLHDSESDRASRLQLSSGDNWFLDVRVVFKL